MWAEDNSHVLMAPAAERTALARSGCVAFFGIDALLLSLILLRRHVFRGSNQRTGLCRTDVTLTTLKLL